MTGLGPPHRVEAADIRLSERWLLTLAASAGRYRCVRDPVVTVLSDVDNTAVDRGSRSRMGGCEVAGPQVTAAPNWRGSAEKGGAFAPRRAMRVGALWRRCRSGARTAWRPRPGSRGRPSSCSRSRSGLPDALTLDASLFKSFWFERSRLTVSLLLKNLLGIPTSFTTVTNRPGSADLVGRHQLLHAPRHALYLSASADVLPYGFVPVLKGARKISKFLGFWFRIRIL